MSVFVSFLSKNIVAAPDSVSLDSVPVAKKAFLGGVEAIRNGLSQANSEEIKARLVNLYTLGAELKQRLDLTDADYSSIALLFANVVSPGLDKIVLQDIPPTATLPMLFTKHEIACNKIIRPLIAHLQTKTDELGVARETSDLNKAMEFIYAIREGRVPTEDYSGKDTATALKGLFKADPCQIGPIAQLEQEVELSEMSPIARAEAKALEADLILQADGKSRLDIIRDHIQKLSPEKQAVIHRMIDFFAVSDIDHSNLRERKEGQAFKNTEAILKSWGIVPAAVYNKLPLDARPVGLATFSGISNQEDWVLLIRERQGAEILPKTPMTPLGA